MRTVRLFFYAVICVAVAAATVSVTLMALDWTAPTAHAAAKQPGEKAALNLIKGKIKPKKARNAGGQWRVDGDMFWRNHKESQFATPGEHTVDFKPIDGWTEPNPKVVTVEAGKTTKVKGKYKRDK
ncbi:MAG: hypothetical protein IT366_02965 [Candidatus Hydrogenedentes bacterium]|nr:hypothetical protein [Candidatus Hydrogenedentota bacterium]